MNSRRASGLYNVGRGKKAAPPYSTPRLNGKKIDGKTAQVTHGIPANCGAPCRNSRRL